MSCAMRSHRIPAGATPPDNCLSSRYAKLRIPVIVNTVPIDREQSERSDASRDYS